MPDLEGAIAHGPYPGNAPFSLILTLPTCGLRTGDLVGLCQLLALLVGLETWSRQGPFWFRPRTLLVAFDTCQQARVAQTGTQTQKEKVLLLLLLWVLSECKFP